MAFSLISGEQVMSDLLTIREKGVLLNLLGTECKLIKCTVAQILQSSSTQGESPSWSRLDCGVVCLIEDLSMHSYFLRLYCIQRAKLLWEQELYIPFKYTATLKFFHTFPGDGYQGGLNFANEVEAEEFHLKVEEVCEKLNRMTEMTSTGFSTSDPPDSGLESLDKLNEEKHASIDISPTTPLPTTNSFKDLDPAMRRLLIQARLTEEDLKGKDIAEAVDCIINKFGGLKAVQIELRNRGSLSQTLPRSTATSISLALKKGPLPPVPSIKDSSTFHRTSQRPTNTLGQSLTGLQIPPLPPNPAPVPTERMRKSASFKHVGSPKATERGDFILTSLREVLKQQQMLQQNTSEDGSQLDPANTSQ